MSHPITLGIFSPYLGVEYYEVLLGHLIVKAQAGGIRVFCIRTGSFDSFDLPIALNHIDGCIILSRAVTTDFVSFLIRMGKPVVSIAYDFGHPEVVVIESDNESCSAHVVNELISAGHQRVAFIGRLANYDIDCRLNGYRRALNENNLPFRQEYIFDTGEYGRGGGRFMAQKILAQKLPITALFAGNDRNAVGAMTAFQANGLRVPEDIAIIGYDNASFSPFCTPPLASVDQNLDQMAQRAIDGVMEQIRTGQRRGGREFVMNTFIPRESSGLSNKNASTPTVLQSNLEKSAFIEGSMSFYEIGRYFVNDLDHSALKSTVRLLEPYIEWDSIAEGNHLLRHPETVTVREIYSFVNEQEEHCEICCKLQDFPPLTAMKKDTSFDPQHFICVLPLISKNYLYLLTVSGRIESRHSLVSVLQNIGLLADAFHRIEINKELSVYQAGLEKAIRQRTEELRVAKENAEAASLAKSAFLANMSHELRSPLNAIMGFTRLSMRDVALLPDTKEMLNTVLKSSEHLYMLINQVLDLSKIEAGAATLTETNLALNILLDEIAEMFSLMAKQKNLCLIVERKSDVPKRIVVDAVKLRQILINLLNNALKFTHVGSVKLELEKLPSIDDEKCHLLFKVVDTGVGIEHEKLSELGKPFVQADAGKKTREGTGLGLALSSSFVRVMGGTLTLSSKLGHGTTVAFDLPVQEVAQAANMTANVVGNPRIVGIAPRPSSHRILVVDDLDEGRELLVRLLRVVGFDVREATNGEEAVTVWKAWSPDLIWMDIRMPIMDGREATRRIKESRKNSPIIIALTSNALEEDEESVKEMGFDDFMSKPFKEHELFELMRKHLGIELIYEDLLPEDSAAPKIDGLQQLPIELRTELKSAIKQLDDELIEKSLLMIHVHNASLAQVLKLMANNYQYKEIVRLIDDCESQDFRE